MRRVLVILLLLVGALVPANAWADGSGQESFSASGLNTLQLGVDNGNLTVNAVDTTNTITITNAWTDGIVAATFQQSNGVLSGDISNPGGDVTVQLPPGLTLNLHASNGNITVTGTPGALTVADDNGSVNIQSGGSSQVVNLSDSNGGIQLNGYTGGGTIGTSNGDVNVTVPGGNGAQLNVSTSNGQIQVAGVTQSGAQVSTALRGGGSLFTIQTSNSNVTVQ